VRAVVPPSLPLYWKVCLINGAVFVAGTLTLVLSPASVSRQPLLSEVLVLAVGLGLMLATNAVLLRRSLAPVDRVVQQMDRLDLDSLDEVDARLGPGSSRRGPGARLVAAFDAMLARLDDERARSAGQALAAQEAERERVAQELHDEVGQSLTVVLLGLKQVERRVPPHLVEVVEELALLRESARTGLDDVRRVARRLRPGVLADLGLHSALASLATDLAAHGGPHVRPEVAPGLPALPAETELVVYRVAQESLTNVARHASARSVRLGLRRDGGHVVLEVDDDGVGPGAGGHAPGSGLAGMAERARLVGGDVEVGRSPQGGTRVRLRVPA
jgi:two-component system, NarL family, sensor histidine kinase UhpB